MQTVIRRVLIEGFKRFDHVEFVLPGHVVVDPFLPVLGADGGAHMAHHHDARAEVGGEGRGARSLLATAHRTN